MWRLSTSAAKVTAVPVARALLQGQVDWIAEPLAFIQPGEILPCCCRAKGDIEIEL
ncbi:putative ferredoxin [Escherichia coli]|uniref:Putative ferredoxin n=1 Tax=Escherichia coli TaxID=562 RepID=A0A376SC25_ECOLX|nr:putative ferredoxin [Escherichia coli]